MNDLSSIAMDEIKGPAYEEHLTAFVDLLGFREISAESDEARRLRVLEFLVSLASLRGEFDVQSIEQQSGTTTQIKPAVSTFSDHIVVSYPIQQISAKTGFDESTTALTILYSFNALLARIASAALSIGFMIRGGATIGKLYHSGGVVFGDALVDAYQLESRTAIYPRVVLSSKISNRAEWKRWFPSTVRRGDDGLFFFNYYSTIALVFSQAIDDEKNEITSRFEYLRSLIKDNLEDLEAKGKLAEFSKWAWFANEFRNALGALPMPVLQAWGISLESIPVPS